MNPIKIVLTPFRGFVGSWKTMASRNFATAKEGTRIIKDAYVEAKGQKMQNYDQAAPDMTDFAQVLDHWGIEPENLERVIKGLRIERAFYTTVGIIGMVVCTLSNSWIVLYDGVVLVILGALVWTCRTWRIRVLENKKFVFFKDWFLRKGGF